MKIPSVFGISTCDSVRRARQWLKTAGIEHHFHDFRKDGLEPACLDRWCQALGWEALLNRRGTTWRQLPPAQREVMDAERARALMLAQPTLIKRPVLETGTLIEVGFDAGRYANLFKG